MSRIAKSPVEIPKGIAVEFEGRVLSVKGKNGSLNVPIHEKVQLDLEEGVVRFKGAQEGDYAMAGTMRSLVANAVKGVSEGFEKRLELVGVGYRAQVQGNKVNLSLGFSHAIDYTIPEGVKIEAPTQTELVVRGIDKQKIGQVAAEIRAFRPPEPYKGKGVRYAGEHIIRKEAKKK